MKYILSLFLLLLCACASKKVGGKPLVWEAQPLYLPPQSVDVAPTRNMPKTRRSCFLADGACFNHCNYSQCERCGSQCYLACDYAMKACLENAD